MGYTTNASFNRIAINRGWKPLAPGFNNYSSDNHQIIYIKLYLILLELLRFHKITILNLTIQKLNIYHKVLHLMVLTEQHNILLKKKKINSFSKKWVVRLRRRIHFNTKRSLKFFKTHWYYLFVLSKMKKLEFYYLRLRSLRRVNFKRLISTTNCIGSNRGNFYKLNLSFKKSRRKLKIHSYKKILKPLFSSMSKSFIKFRAKRKIRYSKFLKRIFKEDFRWKRRQYKRIVVNSLKKKRWKRQPTLPFRFWLLKVKNNKNFNPKIKIKRIPKRKISIYRRAVECYFEHLKLSKKFKNLSRSKLVQTKKTKPYWKLTKKIKKYFKYKKLTSVSNVSFIFKKFELILSSYFLSVFNLNIIPKVSTPFGYFRVLKKIKRYLSREISQNQFFPKTWYRFNKGFFNLMLFSNSTTYDPQYVADGLAKELPKNKAYKKSIHRYFNIVNLFRPQYLQAIRFQITGKLKGSRSQLRTKKLIVTRGLDKGLPRQKFYENISYALGISRTSTGVFGIKVWFHYLTPKLIF